MELKILLMLATLIACVTDIKGCTMDGANWGTPQTISILDTTRGTLFSRTTSDVQSLNSVTHGEDLNAGPYVTVSYENSQFEISTNDAYESYEELETAQTMGVTVTFSCTNGNVVFLIFIISVQDTNNNSPQFIPTNELDFTVMPPLPPGYLITGCLNEIVVRDIDLTTQRIDFAIIGNSDFEIEYDADSSTTSKEFKAVLRTTTFIRTIPESIVLEISATDVDLTGDPALTTYATITVHSDNEFEIPEEPVFSQAIYSADYSADHQLIMQDTISLIQGYSDEVHFSLTGVYSDNFDLDLGNNQVSLTVTSELSADVLELDSILLVIHATREFTSGAVATIAIHLPKVDILGFKQALYEGRIVDNTLELSGLVLLQGYEDETITVSFITDYAAYFNAVINENTITVIMFPLETSIIDENNFINMQVIASTGSSTATTAVTLEIVKDDSVTPVFERTIYLGSYDTNTGLNLQDIVISQGYDETVTLDLTGEYSEYFTYTTGSVISLSVSSQLPIEDIQESQILLSLEASKPLTVGGNTVISISLPGGESELNLEEFDKIIYEGIIQVDAVSHEIITLLRYTGDSIYIEGVYSELFTASIADNTVTVTAAGSLAFPEGISFAILVLQAGEASSVLVLNIVDTDTPVLPSVTFSSPLYVLNVDTVQTGVVGQVQAVADNGESVTYSLDINDEHLQERVSVNNEGEIHLSAPANIGEFSFQVRATTVFTQVTATATVQLKVEDSTICVNDDIVIPPLIIKDADEEEPHLNLVSSPHEGCSYSIRNVWPVDQSWLYVDENGLHTTAIDREHESIAFMALSQVQVELILHCESDASRSKRSTNIQTRLDWLGPYDYGTSKWILTDSIEYNSRRSLVNLIVNDINDNDPIFISKENEPIAVGYPNSELRELIMPRSLAELTATDADVGINAELVYWSSDPKLAVSPATGFVHIREAEELEDYYETTVHATDENGIGRTGSINLMVRILNSNEIAVVTVRDAFLDNEAYIIANLSSAVGYDVKVLNSVVIADSEESDIAIRNKRQTSSAGAILQIYVYGLIERDPVSAERLILDIESNNIASVNIVNTLSLEDHLENIQICPVPGRDTGLLVSTIILAILLFILIVAIVVWFVLKWRKEHSYSEFSDERSLASQAISEDIHKPDTLTRPRLDILELKRSERRLQEMLDAPIEDTAASSTRNLNDTIVNIPSDNNPIVIQSIDKLKRGDETEDEDEFGEVKKPRRKSVVTFNENVEKIIHVEDALDNTAPEYEVYKL